MSPQPGKTTAKARQILPLTSAQKQQRRRFALDEIARAAGWQSWDEYATAVKRGIIVIVARPRKGG